MRWTVSVVGYAMLALLPTTPAVAAPYWVAWEGNDYPENEGWERVVGPNGGSQRSIDGGVLTLNSLEGVSVFDFYAMTRPIDPEPGEQFVLEWRARYDLVSPRTDPGIALFSDQSRSVAFEFSNTEARSVFEPGVSVGFSPSTFHEFRLTSADMMTYELQIDGVAALGGVFVDVATRSEVAWGDAIRGAQSVSQWDYMRFGVVPEPSTATGLIALAVIFGSTRCVCVEPRISHRLSQFSDHPSQRETSSRRGGMAMTPTSGQSMTRQARSRFMITPGVLLPATVSE